MCVLLGMLACNKEKAEKDRVPAPSPSLETIDLCGPQANTERLLQGLLDEGGEEAVRKWVEKNVRVPANFKVCELSSGPELIERVTGFFLRRTGEHGQGGEKLVELGTRFDVDNPSTGAARSLNVYPGGDVTKEGVGLAFQYASKEGK
jgi:hypothetical protein